MGKRTYETDIISMALLYRKQYCKTDMLLLSKCKEYDLIINKNLEEMNTNCGIGIRYEEEPLLYSILTNENKEQYAVINNNFNLEKAWSLTIGCLPLVVLCASQKDNALSIIGLKLVDGKILDINETIKNKNTSVLCKTLK